MKIQSSPSFRADTSQKKWRGYSLSLSLSLSFSRGSEEKRSIREAGGNLLGISISLFFSFSPTPRETFDRKLNSNRSMPRRIEHLSMVIYFVGEVTRGWRVARIEYGGERISLSPESMTQ